MALTPEQIAKLRAANAAKAGATQNPAPVSAVSTETYAVDAPRTSGQKIGTLVGDVARGIIKPIGQMPIQFGRTIASNAANLFGNEEASERLARPVNVPFLGEVKTLGSAPTPSARGMTATTDDLFAQSLETAASVIPGGRGIIGGIKTGLKVGALSGAAEALRKDGETLGDVAKGAAGGALLGGLVSGGASALSSGINYAKSIVKPEVEQLLKSAIRAPKSMANFSNDLKVAVREIAPEAGNIKTLPALASTLKTAKNKVWQGVKEKLAGTAKEASVSLDKAAAKIEALANKPIFKVLGSNKQEELKALAERLKGAKLDPSDAEDILEELNAKEAAYYKKNASSRALAEKADPDLAAELQIADTIREELDSLISGFGDLKKKYGALASVYRAVNDRIPVVERQNITSLAEQMSAARTAGNVLGSVATGNIGSAIGQLGDVAVASTLKTLEAADSKVARAFQQVAKNKKPSVVLPMVKDKLVKPALGAAKRALEMRAGRIMGE
jgi:hypothetical protein